MPFDPSSGLTNLVLGVAAVATAVTVLRSWGKLWDDDFTAADRRLVTQAAVFLVPPVVVLFHELGHVAAALAVGAEVTSFSYGLFEGSVGVDGVLSDTEDWFIAIGGNLVGGLIGLGMTAVGVAASRLRRPVRYLLVMGGLLEVGFTIVFYPVLSLATRFGDWLTIYDFDTTPELSAATLAVHAAALAGLWRWGRSLRSTLFELASGEGAQVQALRAAIDSDPTDPQRRLQLAELYASHGDLKLARSALQDGTGVTESNSVRLHLGLVRLAMFQGQWNEAVVAARRGLAAPDVDQQTAQRLYANLGLALQQMERSEAAIETFSNLTPPVVDDARVRYGRALARLATGDEPGGRADLEAVVAGLAPGDLLRQWAEARLEGRQPAPSDESHLPAYQRSGRTGPPPAPIAGV